MESLSVVDNGLLFVLFMTAVVNTPLLSLGGQTTPSDTKHEQTLLPKSVDNSSTLSYEIDSPRL